MKLDFESIGTIEEACERLDEASKAAQLAATDPDEHAAVEGAFDAVGSVLTSVEGDRQATVRMTGEVRGAELLHVYMDVTIVPSAATQEAKMAETERARIAAEENTKTAAASTDS